MEIIAKDVSGIVNKIFIHTGIVSKEWRTIL
jgi:hypothetical protein